VSNTSDVLATEGTSSEQVTLGLLVVLACESLKVKVVVLSELSKVESLPVESSLLLLNTLVVAVGWRGEFSSIKP